MSVGSCCFPECCVCPASTVLLNSMHTALHSLGAHSGTPTSISTWKAQPSSGALTSLCRVHSEEVEDRVTSVSDQSWGQFEALDLFHYTVCSSTTQPRHSFSFFFHSEMCCMCFNREFVAWAVTCFISQIQFPSVALFLHAFHWLCQVT